MKNVVLEIKQNEVCLKDLTQYDVIGVLWKSGNKSFIQRSEEKGFYSIGSIQKSYPFESKVFYPSILQYCSQEQIKECFVFDDEKELFKWMSE